MIKRLFVILFAALLHLIPSQTTEAADVWFYTDTARNYEYYVDNSNVFRNTQQDAFAYITIRDAATDEKTIVRVNIYYDTPTWHYYFCEPKLPFYGERGDALKLEWSKALVIWLLNHDYILP